MTASVSSLAVPTTRTVLSRAARPSEEALRKSFAGFGMAAEEVEKLVAAKMKEFDGIRATSREFEANFVAMLLAEMKKTVEKNDMFDGGFGEQTFEPMLNLEQARAMVIGGRGMGIAEMVENSLMLNVRSIALSPNDPRLGGNVTQDAVASGERVRKILERRTSSMREISGAAKNNKAPDTVSSEETSSVKFIPLLESEAVAASLRPFDVTQRANVRPTRSLDAPAGSMDSVRNAIALQQIQRMYGN